MGAGQKDGQQFHIPLWFLLLASMARKEMQPTSYQNVRSFSKHQIWCQSPLGWDRVNCLAKSWGQGRKHGQQFHIPFWFLLLASMARKGMQPTAFFKCAFIFKTSNLVSKPPWLRWGYVRWQVQKLIDYLEMPNIVIWMRNLNGSIIIFSNSSKWQPTDNCQCNCSNNFYVRFDCIDNCYEDAK